MRRRTDMVIDETRCIGCGHCVAVCPSETLQLRDGKARVVGDFSLGCGHCVAVCPTDAVTVRFTDAAAFAFETLPQDDAYGAPGEFDAAQLVRLMKSRRSARDFTADPVPLAVLRDLVRVGTTAPSGTNSQKWTFTVLPDRAAVAAFGARIGDFFRKINKLAANPVARGYSRLFLKGALNVYYRDYYETVKEALRQYDEEGRDRLFFNAPAAILVGSDVSGGERASCPAEDALLATQNIVLMAHAMGYGTCLIGFTVEALKNDAAIKDSLGIPRREPIYAVIALGKSREVFRKPAGRRAVIPRIVTKAPA